MKNQQGAALVIVMALLTGALMLGMSGMQSALIDERLAGNYRASVQSQMSGESFLASIASEDNRENVSEFLANDLNDIKNGETKALNKSQLLALSGGKGGGGLDDIMVNASRRGDEITLEAWGIKAGAKMPSVIVFNPGNYSPPFLACRHIQLTGISIAASCNAAEENCLQTLYDLEDYPDPLKDPLFIDAASQRYNLLYNLGNDQGDSIELKGYSHTYGSVRSQRDILFSGSSSIKGNAYFQGDILNVGMNSVLGKEIKIQSSPQRCEMFLDSSSLTQQTATLKQQYGNRVEGVEIGVYPKKQWLLTPLGLFYYDESEKKQNCGFLGLGCFFSDFLSLLGFNVCNLGYVKCEKNQVGWVKHASVVDNVIVVNDLILAQEPTFLVTGDQGDSRNNPARLKMVVEGEFSMSGGGDGLVVEDNAHLELFVKGKTNLASNLQMGGNMATRNGQVPLTINSSYVGEGAVTLSGTSHLVGNIYAPDGVVLLAASRVTGSIWASEINALDNSQLIYIEANMVADGQAIETESATGSGFNWQWR
tara:strand:+ start:1770 stop:3380 length:1611 start_codon:yes stop_codon:yes gene_type:complete